MSVFHDLFGLLSAIPGAADSWAAVQAWWAEPLGQRAWEIVKGPVFIVVAWDLLGRHLYRWIFKRRSRLEQKLDLVEEEGREKTKEISQLRSENKQLTTDLEDAKGRLPQAAIAPRRSRMARSHIQFRRSGSWRDGSRPTPRASPLSGFVSQNFTSLARFLIPAIISTERTTCCDSPAGASPHNREASELSSELDRMNAALQEQLIRDGDARIAWNSAMMPPLGAQGEAILPAVNALRGVAQFCFDRRLMATNPDLRRSCGRIRIVGWRRPRDGCG